MEQREKHFWDGVTETCETMDEMRNNECVIFVETLQSDDGSREV